MKVFADENYLYIKLGILEKFLSARWSFRISLKEISDVHTTPPTITYNQFKIGTVFPGLIKAGTFLSNRGKEFWYVTKKKTFLTIELKKGFYNRIILSLDNNEEIKNGLKDKI